ncbi:hypothetical protein BD324DRAFT_652762 [Kockovaella imperatae]|uniref:Uncharacterized protein n=1 Tax=Kockovaella imperatae TaxID=4999 RepID=A0A1Y1UD93_9TREE|nr:hypothetical protein BD324DRAFT_652762 [Kockovaella imperatae]ORX35045.1 hypothetical protein BD324DRAFT_652762 [Kockovaella imperatae]
MQASMGQQSDARRVLQELSAKYMSRLQDSDSINGVLLALKDFAQGNVGPICIKILPSEDGNLHTAVVGNINQKAALRMQEYFSVGNTKPVSILQITCTKPKPKISDREQDHEQDGDKGKDLDESFYDIISTSAEEEGTILSEYYGSRTRINCPTHNYLFMIRQTELPATIPRVKWLQGGSKGVLQELETKYKAFPQASQDTIRKALKSFASGKASWRLMPDSNASTLRITGRASFAAHEKIKALLGLEAVSLLEVVRDPRVLALDDPSSQSKGSKRGSASLLGSSDAEDMAGQSEDTKRLAFAPEGASGIPSNSLQAYSSVTSRAVEPTASQKDEGIVRNLAESEASSRVLPASDSESASRTPAIRNLIT